MSLQEASILAGVVDGAEWALIVVCVTKKYKYKIHYCESISENKHEPGNMLFHIYHFIYFPQNHK